MRFVKRSASCAGVVALVVLLASCGSSSSSSSSGAGSKAKSVNIAFFGYNTTPYSLAALKAAQAAAAQYGAKITFFNPNSDPQTQATQVQDAITGGKFQAFWIWANNGLALQPLVMQASRAGIKVATADATLGSTTDQATLKSEPGVTVALGTGLEEEATVAVSEIERACAAKAGASSACHVAVMPGMNNFPPDVYRLGLMRKQLAATGRITLSLMPQGDYDAPGAQRSTLDFFQSKPKVDVIYTFADQMIGGVLVALKQLGLTPGKDIEIIGFGATTEAVAGINAGTWYASQALYPSTESRLAVQYLVDAVHGKSVPSLVDVYKQSGALPVIDKLELKQHPSFQPDWSYGG